MWKRTCVFRWNPDPGPSDDPARDGLKAGTRGAHPNRGVGAAQVEISVERLVEAAGVALKAAGKDLLAAARSTRIAKPTRGDAGEESRTACLSDRWRADRLMMRPGRCRPSCRGVAREGPTCPPLRSRVDASESCRRRALRCGRPGAAGAAIDYYHERLKQTPEALAYLDKRG